MIKNSPFHQIKKPPLVGGFLFGGFDVMRTRAWSQ
jgi:hypothetical protein